MHDAGSQNRAPFANHAKMAEFLGLDPSPRLAVLLHNGVTDRTRSNIDNQKSYEHTDR